MVKDIKSIPAKGAWHCYVHKLRAWVAGDDGLPVRPYLMLVVSVEDGKFLACEAGNTPEEAMGGNVVKTEPTSETVLHFLKRVMTHPRQMNSSAAGQKLAPIRPKSINFADTQTATLHLRDKEKWATETACPYVEGCRAGLAEIGIDECSFAPVPPALITDIIRGSIEPGMAPENQEYGTQHLPGLMESVDGFTAAFGKSLFGAAAAYVRAAPWESLATRRPVQITYRLVLREDVSMKLTAFGSVVGSKEAESYGLSVHKTLEDAIKAYELENTGEGEDEANALAAGGQTCMFTSVYETPLEDVDAKEAHGWELASGDGDAGPDEENWPLFCKISFEKGENGEQDTLELTRPAIIELQCFELMFKGMVELLSSGELKSIGDNVRDAAGPWTVKAKSSAGSQAGEEVDIEVEISLPSLDGAGEAAFL